MAKDKRNVMFSTKVNEPLPIVDLACKAGQKTH